MQRLRFEVFNLERGEGLEASFETGLDQDGFDAGCHHLMVIHRREGVVGTYRLMTHSLARLHGGFYSQSEFHFSDRLEALTTNGVEIGRACVHQRHRNGRVILLLFRGLALYLAANHKRYLFGCCSIPTLDEAAAWSLYRQFQKAGQVHPSLAVPVRPELASGVCDTSNPAKLPALFATYLSLGAQVCSEPAVDRAFKVIDFFVVLDRRRLSPQHRAFFFRSRSGEGTDLGLSASE